LRAWLAELQQRSDEVRETFRNEGVRHEQAYVLETADGPVLVYAIEIDDPEAAQRAYASSTLPLDLQHREVMETTISGPLALEPLYDVRL